MTKFNLYGDGDPQIEERIQAKLELRSWAELSRTERTTFLQELFNRDWINPHSQEVLSAVYHLNRSFLRELPGKKLHQIKPTNSGYTNNDTDRMKAAFDDFRDIILTCENEHIILRMLSALASAQIDRHRLQSANKILGDAKKQQEIIDAAYAGFDRLATTLNYLFQQFAINQQVTRASFIPVQDAKITEQIYTPVLAALSDPKYARVSDDLAKMFDDFRAGNAAEAITKGHSALQRFLQIRTGNEGKNGKGELRELLRDAKAGGLVTSTRFGEPLVKVLEGFFPSERATNSTAKPALKEATQRDAMLMMDLVMVFLQHCLAA